MVLSKMSEWVEEFEDETPEPSFIFDELVDVRLKTEKTMCEAIEREYSLSNPQPITQNNIPRCTDDTGNNIIDQIIGFVQHHLER